MFNWPKISFEPVLIVGHMESMSTTMLTLLYQGHYQRIWSIPNLLRDKPAMARITI